MRRALAAADPLGPERREELDRLDFEAMEADLLTDLEDGFAPVPGVESEQPRESGLPPLVPRAARRGRLAPQAGGRRRLLLGSAAAAVAVVVAILLVFDGGDPGRPSRAYGAELIRFAESTPLLLLEGPDWRVQDVYENKTREGTEGQMEFVTGKAVPYPTLRATGNVEEGQRVEGLPPLSVRERKVELRWRNLSEESLATAIADHRAYHHPHGKHFARLPVLDTIAFVDTRTETFLNQGGPHDREMLAIWAEGGYLLELHGSVPSLAAFGERLGWLTKVDSQTWLEAMPAKVVKAADFEATVKDMLKGIPLPKTFAISRVPDENLTTSRLQVEAKVTGTVACLWLRQWGEARRTGDEAAAQEAEKAMASSKHWPIFREPGDQPYTGREIEEVAAAMPRGYWLYRGHPQDLLAHAESLGCAREGLPLLPEKQKRQRENGVPPPPD
jgi:hypothetical protein